MLSQLNSCCNDPKFDVPTFFATHGVESNDVLPSHEDVISHFLNGQCASRKSPGCSEVARNIRSPVKMSGIEDLGKQSLQHLSMQHDLNADPQHNADSLRTDIVDHITSGGCEASSSSLCTSIGDEYQENDTATHNDLEMYILQLAAKKTNLGKKPLRRVLTSRNIGFSNDDSVGSCIYIFFSLRVLSCTYIRFSLCILPRTYICLSLCILSRTIY